jgi:hypothetical protein
MPGAPHIRVLCECVGQGRTAIVQIGIRMSAKPTHRKVRDEWGTRPPALFTTVHIRRTRFLLLNRSLRNVHCFAYLAMFFDLLLGVLEQRFVWVGRMQCDT